MASGSRHQISLILHLCGLKVYSPPCKIHAPTDVFSLQHGLVYVAIGGQPTSHLTQPKIVFAPCSTLPKGRTHSETTTWSPPGCRHLWPICGLMALFSMGRGPAPCWPQASYLLQTSLVCPPQSWRWS
jgi:hypothetical protein